MDQRESGVEPGSLFNLKGKFEPVERRRGCKGWNMEFRRFVSYLYEYAGDEKRRNCGFVRVEVRQDMVRLSLHLQIKEKSREKFQIYGFVRKNERLEGVLIGEAAVQNGIADARFLRQAQCIGENPDAPISIEQLGGIVLLMERGGCYSTVWDEEGFSINNFQKPEEIKKETAQIKEKERADNKEEAKKDEKDSAQKERTRSSAEKLHMQEEAVESAIEQKDEKENKVEDVQKQNTEKPQLQSAAGLEKKDDTKMDWELIARVAIPMKPFAWMGEQQFCFRMEPKDLKYLPERHRYLMNNSFILHGYYNYRYLIIGQSEGRVLIGIPGVYHPMEEMVAAFFGFGEFWPAQERTKQNGSFGYWCRFLY